MVLRTHKSIFGFCPVPLRSRLEVFDSLEGATEAHAEDHANDLDDGDAAGNGDQVDYVVLHEINHLLGTTLEKRIQSSMHVLTNQ